jgi:hypothetical protein
MVDREGQSYQPHTQLRAINSLSNPSSRSSGNGNYNHNRRAVQPLDDGDKLRLLGVVNEIASAERAIWKNA